MFDHRRFRLIGRLDPSLFKTLPAFVTAMEADPTTGPGFFVEPDQRKLNERVWACRSEISRRNSRGGFSDVELEILSACLTTPGTRVTDVAAFFEELFAFEAPGRSVGERPTAA